MLPANDNPRIRLAAERVLEKLALPVTLTHEHMPDGWTLGVEPGGEGAWQVRC